MTDTWVRCAGVKADGTPCKATRIGTFTHKPSHLQTNTIWYCHRHKDQEDTAPIAQ